TWHEDDLPLLPRPLAAREVRYIVDPGLRYYYEDLEFRGLTALTREEARRYFVRADGLLRTRALLRFSRSELDEALGALESALASRGYADAKVTASEVDLNHDTGAVRVVIDVDEGPRYRARAVHIVVRDAEDGPVVRE